MGTWTYIFLKGRRPDETTNVTTEIWNKSFNRPIILLWMNTFLIKKPINLIGTFAMRCDIFIERYFKRSKNTVRNVATSEFTNCQQNLYAIDALDHCSYKMLEVQQISVLRWKNNFSAQSKNTALSIERIQPALWHFITKEDSVIRRLWNMTGKNDENSEEEF